MKFIVNEDTIDEVLHIDDDPKMYFIKIWKLNWFKKIVRITVSETDGSILLNARSICDWWTQAFSRDKDIDICSVIAISDASRINAARSAPLKQIIWMNISY